MYLYIDYNHIFYLFSLFNINLLFLSMNMYANQYNNLQFLISKILDMNLLFKSYITTNIIKFAIVYTTNIIQALHIKNIFEFAFKFTFM